MNKSYFSFLICDHGTNTDFYVNGVPIGVSNSYGFCPAALTIKDKKMPLELNNIGHPFPFKSIEEFKFHLIELIKKIEL